MENTNIKISIAMIVKNEEAMLARCLESVKDADEIVVVDTGSQDKTKEIAIGFTPNIYDFEWVDDFSLARNFAKSKCTGDWILSIDADEFLEPGGITKIKALLSTYKKAAVAVKMKSSNQGFHTVRLFKNSPTIVFLGRSHEVISTIDYERSNIQITFEESPAHKLDPGRNLRILEKAIIDTPDDSRTLYYLGREYGYLKKWDKTIEVLEKYIKVATWFPEKADAFFMLAVCYWNKHQGETARERALSAICLNANFKAPIMLMAEMSFEKNAKQWKKMAETATNEDTLFARENFYII